MRSYAAMTTGIAPQLGDEISSRTLGFKRNETYIWHACITCGKPRWRRLVYLKQGRYLRCRHCAQKGKIVESRARRTVTYHGYISLRMPKYYRADSHGRVMEHIFIWETVHQKQLPRDWVIHHLNGIKDDNRPDNLVAMKRGDHTHLAEPFKKRIRSLEVKVSLLENALKHNQLIFKLEEN